MSKDNSQLIVRSIIGFIVSPLISSIFYTWFSWGEAFFPVVFFAIFVAYMVTLIILFPACLIIFRRGVFNLYSASGVNFVVLFSIFSLIFLIIVSGYGSLISGAEVLVEGGRMTAAGYGRAFYGAFFIGLYGVLGSFVFSVFIRGENIFNFSFV